MLSFLLLMSIIAFICITDFSSFYRKGVVEELLSVEEQHSSSTFSSNDVEKGDDKGYDDTNSNDEKIDDLAETFVNEVYQGK